MMGDLLASMNINSSTTINLNSLCGFGFVSTRYLYYRPRHIKNFFVVIGAVTRCG
jgi:hypothetical protein